MTLHRRQRRLSPRALIAIGALGVALIGAAIWGGAQTVNRSSPSADALARARAKALEAAQGMELVTIEYPKALRGEPSGAPGAFARAQVSFDAAKGELAKVNGAQVDEIAAALNTLRQKMDARAPATEVTALADQTREQLLSLANP